jgi:hypothetical protein
VAVFCLQLSRVSLLVMGKKAMRINWQLVAKRVHYKVMCRKGQVEECKILSPYMAYMPHIWYLLYLLIFN